MAIQYYTPVMPQCNALATFECSMERVLERLSCKICLVYLDDIIMVGEYRLEITSRF